MMISASGCVLAFFIRFSMVLSFDHSCSCLAFDSGFLQQTSSTRTLAL